jgi:hypothetical protein
MYAEGFSEKKFILSENPNEVRPFDGTDWKQKYDKNKMKTN